MLDAGYLGASIGALYLLYKGVIVLNEMHLRTYLRHRGRRALVFMSTLFWMMGSSLWVLMLAAASWHPMIQVYRVWALESLVSALVAVCITNRRNDMWRTRRIQKNYERAQP